jgi:hypothetical protein
MHDSPKAVHLADAGSRALMKSEAVLKTIWASNIYGYVAFIFVIL